VAPFAVFIGLIIVAELITIIWINSSQFSNTPAVIQQSSQMGNTLLLGTELFTNYILDFEIAGFILLLAIIVAISLTLRPRKNLKTQVASEQINVDPKERMKLIDLKDTK
jgi:NADH-quinone oxidoreductase subunit J